MDIIVKPSFQDKIIKGFKDPVYFHKEIFKRDLHEGQEKCLRSMVLKDTFIACGNRYGKGDIALGYFAWLSFYKPVEKRFKDVHVNLLNTSISQDQANIIFNKFEQNAIDVDSYSWIIQDIKKSPFPNITFKNNQTLWFRNATQNGKYLEGRSYFHINFDESDLQDGYKEFIEEILEPRTWDFGGNISHMTTPRRGKRNAYKIYNKMNKAKKNGDDSVYIHNGDSRINKFLSSKAIGKMNKLPQRLINKNVKGLFEDSNGDIDATVIDYAEHIATGILEEPIKGRKYVNAWDLARSSTYCCGATLEIPFEKGKPLQLVSWERFEDHEKKDRSYWLRVENAIKKRHNKWVGKTVIDRTGLGDVVFSHIEDINPIGVILAPSLRNRIIDEGVSVFEKGLIGTPKNISQLNKDTGEIWLLSDEISDFDKENTDNVIWDMVCAIFLAVWVGLGKPVPGHIEESSPRILISRVRGVQRK